MRRSAILISIMAIYKVPQDVEADDKLIGPFSFRQFIYLFIVAMAIGLMWGLGQLAIPLALIPLPVVIFFGAIALPLRKDQPMEIYMAALVSFYLKPNKRRWDPDGIDSLVEITAPKTPKIRRTKDISQNEAEKRFSYLAQIVDSQGWAVRGSNLQTPNSAMNSDVYFEAQQVQDILDSDNATTQAIDYKLQQDDARKRQEMIDLARGQSVATQPVPSSFSYPTLPEPITETESIINGQSGPNPYPDDIQQSVLDPITASPVQKRPVIEPIRPIVEPPPTTSEKIVSAGIINLASNNDLSIEAIAREAKRIQDKQSQSEEVIISLR